ISPAIADIQLERYDSDTLSGHRVARAIGPLSAPTTSLAPGSYRLLLSGRGLARVIYPFEVRRGEEVVVEVSVPASSSVPEDFVYVAPGDFWFGDADEQLRTQFLGTVPIHHRRTGGYSIA